MSAGRLRVERDGPIGRLVLDNPERRNAINAQMWRAIAPAIVGFEADPEVRCIVLRGEGSAAFAAGADISEFEKNRASESDVKAYEAATSAAHHAIEHASKPVIAQIHGFCVGGGLAVALSCDLRYADASSQFAIPAARLGLGYGIHGTGRLVSTVGHAMAREIMFSARRFSSAEALAMGAVAAHDVKGHVGTMATGVGHHLIEDVGRRVVDGELGAEILRLWVAASDYSGDIAGDDKVLARIVDAYRRIRNTLRFLLANTSDFDPGTDAVPNAQLLEIDRWALARAAEVQAEFVGAFDDARGVFDGGHYKVYEFHPVVAKLQLFCSEDLGAFYLDVLKDRLYTTAPKSLARRSAQTALWQITHAMLRWMAPFLSFTAEEAWKVLGGDDSIFTEIYWKFDAPTDGSDGALLTKWARIREIRVAANKAIEDLRTAGQVGSSLQATLALHVPAVDRALLDTLGDALKFVFITSAATLTDSEALRIEVVPSTAPKCERCWHYRDDVGADPAHPTICGRCVSNLHGAGEARTVA